MNEKCPKKKLGIKVRQVGDHFFLIDFLTTYSINETTLEIVRLCTGQNSIETMIRLLTEKYPNEPKEKIAWDVQNVLAEIEKAGIIG